MRKITQIKTFKSSEVELLDEKVNQFNKKTKDCIATQTRSVLTKGKDGKEKVLHYYTVFYKIEAEE